MTVERQGKRLLPSGDKGIPMTVFIKNRKTKKDKVRASLWRTGIFRSDGGVAFLMCAPAVLLLLVFRIFSLFYSLYVSLFDWSFKKNAFIGLQNYVEMFTRDIVRYSDSIGLKVGALGQSLLVTTSYALITIPISIGLSFLFAYLLFYGVSPKLQSGYRIAFFLPYITSTVAAIFVFRWMANSQYGLFNVIIKALGLPPQEWASDPVPILEKILNGFGVDVSSVPDALLGPTWALCVIMIYSIWSSIGFNVVIYLAGLSGISPELYEAAQIDGANKLQSIIHVTLPLVSPTTLFLSITSVIGAFESFNAFYLFTGGSGSPNGSTSSISMYIFNNFYQYNRAGYACALSALLFAIVLILTVIQKKISDKTVFYG